MGNEAGSAPTGCPAGSGDHPGEVSVLPHGAGLKGVTEQPHVAFSASFPRVIPQVMAKGSRSPGTSSAQLGPAALPAEVPCSPGSTHTPGPACSRISSRSLQAWRYPHHVLNICSPLLSQTSTCHFFLSLLPHKSFICKLDPHNNSTRWEVLLFSVYRWGNRATELGRWSWDLPLPHTALQPCQVSWHHGCSYTFSGLLS